VTDQTTPGEVQPAAGGLLVAGMVSSTSAQLVSYPLGLVRTRLQARSTMNPLVWAAP
jgi:Mitochondrial carrier protein